MAKSKTASRPKAVAPDWNGGLERARAALYKKYYTWITGHDGAFLYEKIIQQLYTAILEPGDTIILSSTPIPGNEKAVAKVINDLSLLGAKVAFQDTHVSGHACREEIKLLYALTKPKYSIPIHGEFRHRQANFSQPLTAPSMMPLTKYFWMKG